MRWNAKVRATIACFGLVSIFTVFSFRLVYLQVAKHEQYTALAARKHFSSEVLYAPRGVITDINNEVLAEDVPVRKAYADGSIVNNPAGLADIFATPLKMDRDRLAQELLQIATLAKQAQAAKLAGKIGKTPAGVCDHALNKDVTVSEEVAAELTEAMRKKNLRGIFFKPDTVRSYPNDSMLCHVLGYLNHDHAGVNGIEQSLNAQLQGHNGYRYFEHDRTGKELVAYGSQEKAPQRGCDVRLTIDMELQDIVEKELDGACKQYKPVMAVSIIMRPQTGEILAMANRPNFNPNDLSDAKGPERSNAAIETMVEPGSVFKIVPVGAAFDQKLLTPDTMIDCERSGRFKFAGSYLHDHKPMGELPVSGVLAKSSNIGAGKIGISLGDQRLYDYIRKFGFGERTDVSLPGESSGELAPPYRWSKLSITRLPMGQEVGVTPLQLITAMSAIANGGHLMMPQIIHEVVDEDGHATNYPPVEVRQVISTEAAKQVRECLEGVERKGGTAVEAAIPGFIGAGKTGTAQKKGQGAGYLHDKYVLSFVGMLPADKPEFVCLVMLDSPEVKDQEQNYGGQVAAPIFARIAQKTACHLNMAPHFDQTTQPVQIALTQAKAR